MNKTKTDIEIMLEFKEINTLKNGDLKFQYWRIRKKKDERI